MQETLVPYLTAKGVMLAIRAHFGDETDEVLAACRIRGRPNNQQKALRHRLAIFLNRIPDHYKYRTTAIAYALGMSEQRVRKFLKSVRIS